MKLGAFYGCTAPIMLLIYNRLGNTKFIEAISKLDNATDRISLNDARDELASFIANVTKYPNKYNSTLSKLDENKISKLGKINKDSINFQECRMFLMVKIVEKILTLLDTNEVDISVLCASSDNSNEYSEQNALTNLRSTLDARIDKIMHSQSHEPGSEYLLSQEILTMHNSIVRRFIRRSNQAEEHTGLDVNEIRTFLIKKFKIKTVLESVIIKGSKTIYVNENCLKIIQYYKEHLTELKDIESLFQSSVKQNVKLFDCNARVFFRKQPDHITRIVRAAFKSPSIVTNRSRLLNEKNRLLEEVKKTQNFINSYVVSKTSKSNLVGVTDEQLLILESNSNPDSVVIQALKTEQLTAENLTIDTIELLFEIDNATNISLEDLNTIYGTNYNYEEFEQDVQLLNELNIGGLSCFSHYLFSKSLSSVTLSLFDKVIVDDSLIEDFKYYIEEVEILLNNMKGVD